MASQWLTWVARGAVTAAFMAALALLSDFSIGQPATDGVLRLAWRTVGQKASLCRVPSAEELEKQPAHMRRATVCEDWLLPYVLTVEVDGQARLERRIHSIGARSNRPLFVQEDLPMTPGSHRVRVSYVPDQDAAREAAAGEARQLEWQAILAPSIARAGRYIFDAEAKVIAGRVTLIQLQEQAGTFVVSGP